MAKTFVGKESIVAPGRVSINIKHLYFF